MNCFLHMKCWADGLWKIAKRVLRTCNEEGNQMCFWIIHYWKKVVASCNPVRIPMTGTWNAAQHVSWFWVLHVWSNTDQVLWDQHNYPALRKRADTSAWRPNTRLSLLRLIYCYVKIPITGVGGRPVPFVVFHTVSGWVQNLISKL